MDYLVVDKGTIIQDNQQASLYPVENNLGNGIWVFWNVNYWIAFELHVVALISEYCAVTNLHRKYLIKKYE